MHSRFTPYQVYRFHEGFLMVEIVNLEDQGTPFVKKN